MIVSAWSQELRIKETDKIAQAGVQNSSQFDLEEWAIVNSPFKGENFKKGGVIYDGSERL